METLQAKHQHWNYEHTVSVQNMWNTVKSDVDVYCWRLKSKSIRQWIKMWDADAKVLITLTGVERFHTLFT